MSIQIESSVFPRLSSPIELRRETAKTLNLDLDRPLYVRGEAFGNLISLGMFIVLSALTAPQLYLATVLVINLYLLNHLPELAVM